MTCAPSVHDDRAPLLDVMVGTLATSLRMCGYDAASTLDRDVEGGAAIRALADAAGRILVTRDIELAAAVPEAISLTGTDIRDQLAELAAAGVPLALADPPTRCGRCNGDLVAVQTATGTPSYAPDPSTQPVWRCRACGQYFWRGSHWTAVRETLDALSETRSPF